MEKSKVPVNRSVIIISVRLHAVVTVAINLLQIIFLALVSHTHQHQISFQVTLSSMIYTSPNLDLLVKMFLKFSFSLLNVNSQESTTYQHKSLSLTCLLLYSLWTMPCFRERYSKLRQFQKFFLLKIFY